MAFTLNDRTLNKVGVIGSGQIGPDIALFFTKVLAPHGVPVVVVDVSEEALAAGRKRTEKKINKGVESGAFRPEQARAMLDNLTFTADYAALKGADFVVEAATEDLSIKHKIFEQLERVSAPGAILASNSSHMEPEVIFERAADRRRCLVIHYFFPAERNIVVEVVPGAETDPEIGRWLLQFFEEVGKAPILVKSRYGYAIDPIFEGLFQAAALLVEDGYGTTRQVDAITQKALGMGIGPFTAMNLTGGNPLTKVGLDHYHEKIHGWFRAPKLLNDQLERGEAWDVVGRNEQADYDQEQYERVAARMTGAYFGLVTEILDSGISNVSDLEMAVETALVVRAPFSWMNRLGVGEALALVRAYAEEYPAFPIPKCLRRQAESGRPFPIPLVLREDRDGVAILKIRRPKVLNALNAEVFSQLAAHVTAIESDPDIAGTVITGFGKKAFVSGGDIGMLARLDSKAAGEAGSLESQAALNVIEDCGKPVVCAMNGLAFGGGNELAMACDARLAPKGLRVFVAQPEVNLGIIPGAGGTQRLPRWVGFEAAAGLMRTGRPISSGEAVAMGLIREEVEGDLIDAAVGLVREAAAGRVELPSIPAGPLQDVPDTLPGIDLGHLSRKIDELLCRAILEGARLPLREGLALEARLFGECCATEDMRRGMKNFFEHGPKAKAEFVNR